MSDLISKQALLNDFRNTITEQSRTMDWLNLINRQPIAYDVDKVVEQLEERKLDNIRISKLQGNSYIKKMSHICRSDEDEYSIRLVKRAVKDE